MKQGILNFKFSHNRDFFVSPKNSIAFNLIKSWPNWNVQMAYIYGPEKCGKTLISNLWQKKSNAKILDEIKLKKFIKNSIDIEDVKQNNWIIDNIEYFIEKKYDEKILNLINIIFSSKDSFILITSKNSPKFLNSKVKDLLSRLSSSIVIEVFQPDNDLLCKIIKKYLNERSISISKKSLEYLILRIERSYQDALGIAKKIDKLSLETHSNINYRFLKKLIDSGF